jgi:hypothetical protein
MAPGIDRVFNRIKGQCKVGNALNDEIRTNCIK